jgi:PhzF family phenazine biosynthesis protein
VRIPIYWADAFTDHLFTGNPAAVCILDDYLDDDLLQAIATENNLSETAFLVADEGFWHIRWFTPGAEVNLCGHATLASAAVVSRFIDPEAGNICFESMSGPLSVRVEPNRFVLDFPLYRPERATTGDEIAGILGTHPEFVLQAEDMQMAVMDTEARVANIEPDMERLLALDALGLIVTAPGSETDFVSRFFAPKLGVPEDPVTGSAHCMLIPYWSEVLQKEDLLARQVSSRGGVLHCRNLGDRVEIGGGVVHYLEGTIKV